MIAIKIILIAFVAVAGICLTACLIKRVNRFWEEMDFIENELERLAKEREELMDKITGEV